jgi:hypothetical protein
MALVAFIKQLAPFGVADRTIDPSRTSKLVVEGFSAFVLLMALNHSRIFSSDGFEVPPGCCAML